LPQTAGDKESSEEAEDSEGGKMQWHVESQVPREQNTLISHSSPTFRIPLPQTGMGEEENEEDKESEESEDSEDTEDPEEETEEAVTETSETH